jgi:hypothetical protein
MMTTIWRRNSIGSSAPLCSSIMTTPERKSAFPNDCPLFVELRRSVRGFHHTEGGLTIVGWLTLIHIQNDREGTACQVRHDAVALPGSDFIKKSVFKEFATH